MSNMESLPISNQVCFLNSSTSNPRTAISGEVYENSSSSSSKESSRAWSDLPSELLTLIALRLPIIELLCFRVICRQWYAASFPASAQIESGPDQNPWLLLQKGGSEWRLYRDSQRHYRAEIPDMDGGTACLASHQGWLLLFKQGSIFFLCPLSSAKIVLPRFPHPEISDHVGAFSSLPTSPDCVVSVINRADHINLDLHLLRRGEENWSKHVLTYNIDHFKTIICASYHDGDFFFLDGGTGALTFGVKSQNSTRYRVVDRTLAAKGTPSLPFSRTRYHFDRDWMEKVVGSAEKVTSVTICGTRVENDGSINFLENESISENADDDGVRYRGVWIFPRFFQIPRDQRW